MLSYLGETVAGASTIRAFKRSDEFILSNNKYLNDNIRAIQSVAGVNCWFSIRVDLLAITLMLIFAYACILSRDSTSPVILSMLLSYVLTIQMTLTSSLKTFMNLQSSMVNATRCVALLGIP